KPKRDKGARRIPDYSVLLPGQAGRHRTLHFFHLVPEFEDQPLRALWPDPGDPGKALFIAGQDGKDKILKGDLGEDVEGYLRADARDADKDGKEFELALVQEPVEGDCILAHGHVRVEFHLPVRMSDLAYPGLRHVYPVADTVDLQHHPPVTGCGRRPLQIRDHCTISRRGYDIR